MSHTKSNLSFVQKQIKLLEKEVVGLNGLEAKKRKLDNQLMEEMEQQLAEMRKSRVAKKKKKSGFLSCLLSILGIVGYISYRWKFLNHIDDKEKW